jgi:hypothetical protein
VVLDDVDSTHSKPAFKRFPACIVTISSSAGEFGVDRGREAVGVCADG